MVRFDSLTLMVNINKPETLVRAQLSNRIFQLNKRQSENEDSLFSFNRTSFIRGRVQQ